MGDDALLVGLDPEVLADRAPPGLDRHRPGQVDGRGADRVDEDRRPVGEVSGGFGVGFGHDGHTTSLADRLPGLLCGVRREPLVVCGGTCPGYPRRDAAQPAAHACHASSPP